MEAWRKKLARKDEKKEPIGKKWVVLLCTSCARILRHVAIYV